MSTVQAQWIENVVNKLQVPTLNSESVATFVQRFNILIFCLRLLHTTVDKTTNDLL